MGVSEDEVRRIVDDIRINNRSHEIASGIIQQENARRKRLDSTAALTAAIAFVIVGLVAIGGFVFWNSRADATPPAIETHFSFPPELAEIPDNAELDQIAQEIARAAMEATIAALEAERASLEAQRADSRAVRAQDLDRKIAELQRKADEIRRQIRQNRTTPIPPPTPPPSGR